MLMPSLAQYEWLTGLALLWAVLLFGGFVLGTPNADRTRRMPAWTRLGSSLTLVVAAWSWTWFTRGSPASSFAFFIAIGMSLGFLGDLFMAGLMPGTRPVLWGIAAFGLCHGAYIIALLHLGNQTGLNAAGPRWTAWAVWLLIGSTGWYLVVYRGRRPTTLHRATLPYMLLLASTAGLATGLALQAPSFVPLAIGAALFLVSDLVLAARLFREAWFPLIHDVVWLTYGPAQALIVYSVGAALGVMGSR